MDIALTFAVSDELLRKCQEITMMKTYINSAGEGDIEIVANRYFITPRTKMIQCIYGSLENLDLRGISEFVKVCKNAGAFADSVSEHVFAMLLPLIRKISYYNSRTHRKIFKKETVETLQGKTIGILGYGGVGSRIASIAKDFGMNIVAYTRSPKDDPNVSQYYQSVSKLLPECDILLISLPPTKRTYNIIKSDQLSLFSGNIIINISAPDVIKKEDLLWYLKRFPEKYYLTDVWWGEPLINESIPENCVLTPHMAGDAPGEFEKAVLLACHSVRNYVDGITENIVDPREYTD